MRRPRRQRRKSQSFDAMIPNILTTLALCAGLTALRFSLEGRFENAVEALVIAGVLDTFDGAIARLLKQTSNFGAQLDTLSDFLAFGIVPAAMLYLWSLNELGLAGWAVSLVYAVCCALRLARFNVQITAPRLPPEARSYFVGVPSPIGAGLVLVPLAISFTSTGSFAIFFQQPMVVGAIVLVVSGLMVSQLPTFSVKQIRIPHRYRLLTMLGVAVLAAAIVSAPWQTLTLLVALYAVTLPLGWRSYNRLIRRVEAAQAETDAGDGSASGAVLPSSVERSQE